MKRNMLLLTVLGLMCLGAAHARRAPKTAPFPSLAGICNQNADITAFRINATAVRSTPAQTYCFSFGTAAPMNPSVPCGQATQLERIQLWASYDLRRKITGQRIRDSSGERTVFASWTTRNVTQDEMVFSQLNWTPEYIRTANPRLCLTLAADATLDTICQGPAGSCTFALYSSAAGTSKCCPVYRVPTPAA